MTVHNHGTEDGPGLACPETRRLDGTLRGACLPVTESEQSESPFGRAYHRTELAAAKRVGLLTEPGRGPLYWAGGPYWPNEARKQAELARKKAADWTRVAEAMEREWAKNPAGQSLGSSA